VYKYEKYKYDERGSLTYLVSGWLGSLAWLAGLAWLAWRLAAEAGDP